MDQEKRPTSPGLKWRNRKHGPPVPYWFADPKAIDMGYEVRSANLSALSDNPAALVKRARRLQDEMLLWMKGATKAGAVFDGRFNSLLEIYETDPESTFHVLKPGVKHTYGVYIGRLKRHIGEVRIGQSDGRAVKRWFNEWRYDEDGKERLPRARMVLAVLKAAVSFGVVCRMTGVKDFQHVLGELEFPRPKRRGFAPTAEQIIAARKAAHARGAPERALVYALQFETTLRQWDIIGQWLPLSDPKPSAILHKGMKWVGMHWSAVGAGMILERVKPTKTEDTSDVDVSFDLSVCPMVCEELTKIPTTGPMIVNSKTGLPYFADQFEDGWKGDFLAAGLSEKLWNRDLRAGGITEGGKAGASLDDRSKLAGHTQTETTEIYDRDMVEAHRRVMEKRVAFRPKNTT